MTSNTNACAPPAGPAGASGSTETTRPVKTVSLRQTVSHGGPGAGQLQALAGAGQSPITHTAHALTRVRNIVISGASNGDACQRMRSR
jgi:hypothetical protein